MLLTMHNIIMFMIVIVLLLQSSANSILHEMTGVQETPSRVERHICSRSTACKYVICLRRNRNSNSCTFVPLLIDTNCVCPHGQICSINTDMSEAIPPFVYHYHCRDPWQAIGVPNS